MKREAKEDESAVSNPQDHPDAKKAREEIEQEEIAGLEEKPNMAEHVEEAGKFLNLLQLPYPAKSLVISKLDLKSRKALRACSLDMHGWMDSSLFFNVDYLALELKESTAPDGTISYDLTVHSNQFMSAATKNYKTVEQLESFLQQNVFKNIDYVDLLDLTIENFTSPIQLIKNRMKLRVGHLWLAQWGHSGVVAALQSQIHPSSLSGFYLEGEGCDERVFGAFKPHRLVVHATAVINDTSLLSIRAREAEFLGSGSITVPGLKQFLKRMLQDGETTNFYIGELNEELGTLFNFRGREEIFIFHVSPRYSNHSMKITLDEEDLDHTFEAELVPRRDSFPEDSPEPDNEAIRQFITFLQIGH